MGGRHLPDAAGAARALRRVLGGDGPNDRFASSHAARLAETGRDDRLFRFGGYDQRHEVTDYFEVFVPDIHRKIPDVYPNSDRTVAEDLDTGLAAYHALTVSYPHSPYGLG